MKRNIKLIEDVQKLVRIPSVQGECAEGAPFGLNNLRALECLLELGNEMGFITKNVDGYAGHIECGNGKELIGIFVHVDVVPPGEGWTYPPFGAEIHDGKIWGRGTLDDKGPAVAVLHAMKEAYDKGTLQDKRVRLIIGTNEEDVWTDMEYYLEREEHPIFSFTPDANFPLIYAEKGILDFDIFKKIDSNDDDLDIVLLELSCGVGRNMLPATAQAIYECKNPKLLNEFKRSLGEEEQIKIEDKKIILTIKGRSTHCSTPEEGINAVTNFLKLVGSIQALDLPVIQELRAIVGEDNYGSRLEIDCEDKVSGRLTFNPGIITLQNKQLKIQADIRYPVTIDGDTIQQDLIHKLKELGCSYKEVDHLKPVYLEQDNALVKKLMKVYRNYTGADKTEAMVIGGGTYAGVLPNTVAFVPLFPYQRELAPEEEEFIEIGHLEQLVELYTPTIIEFAK